MEEQQQQQQQQQQGAVGVPKLVVALPKAPADSSGAALGAAAPAPVLKLKVPSSSSSGGGGGDAPALKKLVLQPPAAPAVPARAAMEVDDKKEAAPMEGVTTGGGEQEQEKTRVVGKAERATAAAAEEDDDGEGGASEEEDFVAAELEDAGEEDEEMARAVAEDAPVELHEEGAIEAYTEARQEQLKQMEEIKAKRAAQESTLASAAGKGEDKAQRRLEYLMAQSEMFAHFLGAQAFQAKKPGRKSASKGSVKMSMGEQEEDAALMKTATSNSRVTRLTTQPKLIQNGTMRPYQLEGLNWMIKLHDNGINGILADEMGLGKTLQTISLLAYLSESRNMHGPHIVIVPKSTVGNWMRELGKWLPSFTAVKLLGTKDERADMVRDYLHSKGAQRPFNVVVTSYEGVLKERSALEKIQWRYIIIDEAHRIKNEKSALSKAVRSFKAHFRLLITGTPLQNDLHELWALLNYIMPDVFDSSDTFDEWFSMDKGGEGTDNVIRKLHQVLKPFMLRRVKGEVEKDLPPKKETKLYIAMTDMQRDWYRRILRRDGAALNMLGGAGDKLRLLNILMQLRKVCNHPYLFEGAEPGPPYMDGPHLWENCGKMHLLNKLLPKLKEQGSRVLIFSQMTRQLDILEDYLRLKQYQYCRIDGSTKGEDRDNAVETFNAPNSPKFVFILSTRAGGLGINLATADTVIIYDSDWNPQVDLQAMDRAHRIGQTKEVRVFRFITEGTVEEKIVERADRKLFLDAAVIQQGRLAEKHSTVSKDELLTMVKFGADEILNATGEQGLTDEDIDLILQRGESRTEELKAKYQTNVQHNLAKFTLLDDTEERNLFEFEGKDYSNRRKDGIVFDMGQRERKPTMNYDVDSYYRSALKGGTAAPAPKEKRPRRLVLPEHQFFNRPRLHELHEKEQALLAKRTAQLNFIKELRAGRKAAVQQLTHGERPEEVAEQLEQQVNDGLFELSVEEQAERERLREEGFKDWSRKDLRALVNALEKHGRGDTAAVLKEIVAETGKAEEEVRLYYDTFWERFEELPNWQPIMERIRRGEQRIARNKEIRALLDERVAPHKKPWQTLKINYGPQSVKMTRLFSDEEDVFLLLLMHRFEYGNWERIRLEIRKSEKFAFDWFFKSRTAAELQKRGDTLIKLLEREKAETSRGGAAGKRKRAGEEGSAGGPEEEEDESEEEDEMEEEEEEEEEEVGSKSRGRKKGRT